jgi:hypothetical protein
VKFSLCNQVVGLIVAALSRPLDDQKLRLSAESIKTISAKLSTGRDVPGGQLGKCLTVF